MNFGNLLKEKRVKLRLSLEQASTILKLSPKLLKALEDDNTNIFFSKTYFLGYLKQYSNFLGINYDQDYFFVNTKTELKFFQLDSNANTNPGVWAIITCLLMSLIITILINCYSDNLSQQKNWLWQEKKYVILE